ncbi:MAG TPA: hypothetical protein DEQ06_08665, partial [Porphyromonadaceae bacterium]|nr:hypothetical protein [Porphyromonadaceae bacterium]
MKKTIDTLHYKIRSRWLTFIQHKKQQRVRLKILSYYAQHPSPDTEIQEAVSYLSEHPLTTFYGTFQEKYHADDVPVFTDTTIGLPYVMAEGKKLYFKRSHHKRTVQLLYNALRIEQDPDAPHC